MSRAKTDDAPAGGTQRWDVSRADVEQAQLETMLAAAPAQRLAWLEEAMRLAYASGALGANRGPYSGPDCSAPPSSPPARQTANRPSEEEREANQGPESSSGNRR